MGERTALYGQDSVLTAQAEALAKGDYSFMISGETQGVANAENNDIINDRYVVRDAVASAMENVLEADALGKIANRFSDENGNVDLNAFIDRMVEIYRKNGSLGVYAQLFTDGGASVAEVINRTRSEINEKIQHSGSVQGRSVRDSENLGRRAGEYTPEPGEGIQRGTGRTEETAYARRTAEQEVGGVRYNEISRDDWSAEMEQLAQENSDKYGVETVYFAGEAVNEAGDKADAFYYDGVLYLQIDGEYDIRTLRDHEVTHHQEGTEAHDVFKESVKKKLGKEKYDKLFRRYTEKYNKTLAKVIEKAQKESGGTLTDDELNQIARDYIDDEILANINAGTNEYAELCAEDVAIFRSAIENKTEAKEEVTTNASGKANDKPGEYKAEVDAGGEVKFSFSESEKDVLATLENINNRRGILYNNRSPIIIPNSDMEVLRHTYKTEEHYSNRSDGIIDCIACSGQKDTKHYFYVFYKGEDGRVAPIFRMDYKYIDLYIKEVRNISRELGYDENEFIFETQKIHSEHEEIRRERANSGVNADASSDRRGTGQSGGFRAGTRGGNGGKSSEESRLPEQLDPGLPDGKLVGNRDEISDKGRGNRGLNKSKKDAQSVVERAEEAFSDSVIRGDDGKLKVMYRGGGEEIHVFDRKKSKPSNLYGRGFYFTDSESAAKQYGDVRKYYLNVKTPLSPGQSSITKEQMRNFLEAIAENEDDYDIWNYGTTNIDEILNNLYGKGDFEMLQDVNATAIGDLVEAVELFNEVNGTEYDGIVLDTETVVFDSAQIKSADEVTYDDEGKEIPMSKRFSGSKDVRFNISDGNGDVNNNDGGYENGFGKERNNERGTGEVFVEHRSETGSDKDIHGDVPNATQNGKHREMDKEISRGGVSDSRGIKKNVEYPINPTIDSEHSRWPRASNRQISAEKRYADALKRGNSAHKVMVLVDFVHNGRGVIAPIEVDAEQNVRNIKMDVNHVATYFDKKNISDILKEALALESQGKTGFYFDDIKRVAALLKGQGYQLPKSLRTHNSNVIVRKINTNVNRKIDTALKSHQFLKWFGDWRANDNTKIDYVSVNSHSIDIADIPRGEFKNTDTNRNIESVSTGIDETAHKMGKWSSEYHALKDIDKMVANAILLDTVVANNPSKKMGKTTVLVHHLYCPVQFFDKTEKGIAKLYITESIEGRKKFYLNKIEMSSDTRGSADNKSAPPRNIGSASDDKISVAEIYAFVNEHDVDYEKDSKNPVYFKPNQPSKIVNNDGTPKVLYHQTENELQAKVNSLYDLVDILATAKYDGKEIEESYEDPNIKPKNKAHKNVKYWYKFKNTIYFDDVLYDITFNIRDKGKKQYQYLIEFLEKNRKATHNSNTAKKSLLRTNELPSNKRIPQNDPSVNSNSMQKSEKNAQNISGDNKNVRFNISDGNGDVNNDDGGYENGFGEENSSKELGWLGDSSETKAFGQVGEVGQLQQETPNTPHTRRIHRNGVSARILTTSGLTAEQAALKQQNNIEERRDNYPNYEKGAVIEDGQVSSAQEREVRSGRNVSIRQIQTSGLYVQKEKNGTERSRREKIKEGKETSITKSFDYSKDVRFNLSGEPFDKQVDKILSEKTSDGNHAYIGETTSILKQIGLDDLPMLITKGHIRDRHHEKVDGQSKYHGLSETIIKKIPHMLNYPALIFDSLKYDNRVCILTNELDFNEKPIVIAIKPNGDGKFNDVKVESNFVLTAYGKDGAQVLIDDLNNNIDNVLFVNKIKTQELIKGARLQLPARLNNLKSNYIILKSNAVVKAKSVKKSCRWQVFSFLMRRMVP